jgi:hypothetical protein
MKFYNIVVLRNKAYFFRRGTHPLSPSPDTTHSLVHEVIVGYTTQPVMNPREPWTSWSEHGSFLHTLVYQVDSSELSC